MPSAHLLHCLVCSTTPPPAMPRVTAKPAPNTHGFSFMSNAALGAGLTPVPLIPLFSWGSNQANESRVTLRGKSTTVTGQGQEGCETGGRRRTPTQAVQAS